MVGLFVAASVVSLVQFLRVRDRRLLLLAAMFAFQSQALAREWYDVWRDVFQAGVCATGLALLPLLPPVPDSAAPRARSQAPASEPRDQPVSSD